MASEEKKGEKGELAPKAGRREGVGDYLNILFENKNYRLIFLASVLQQLGTWGNLIACLKIIEGHGGSGVKAATVYFLRSLPSVVLFPIAGYLADKYDRKLVMIASNVLSMLTALSFVILTYTDSLTLLFILIFAKNACSTIYDPAKRAAIPMFVDAKELHIAMTLDGVAWSSMLALGAALGGLMTSSLGLRVCFILDASGYMGSVCCLLFLPQLREECHQEVAAASGASLNLGYAFQNLKKLAREFASDTIVIFNKPSLRVSLLYATMKATGGIVWGPADVLNLKWSERENLQIFSDLALTLGFSYAFVGAGCFIGPPLSNFFFDPKQEVPLLRSIIFGIGLLSAGYVFWSLAFTFWVISLGNCVRSSASAIIYIRSTIILQLYTDRQYLGRCFALESCFYTLFNSLSTFSVGLLIDNDGMSERQICIFLAASAAMLSVLWWQIQIQRRRQLCSEASCYELVRGNEL